MYIFRIFFIIFFIYSFTFAQKSLNPDISVIGDFLIDTSTTRFALREVELGLQGFVDPYARADIFLAVSDEGIDIEEGYITILSLPFSTQLKMGVLRPSFGKINIIHPSETYFTDTPSFITNFFGEEGLVEKGVSIDVLVPNPWDYYLETSIGIFNGNNAVSFSGGASKKLLYLSHIKSFIELNDASSLETGFSMARGENNKGLEFTTLLGVDLTYKWKSPRYSLYKSFVFQNEFLYSIRNTRSIGLFSFIRYQLSRQWFLGIRYDYSQFPDSSEKCENAFSFILTLFTSEFARYRIQYKYISKNYDKNDSKLFFQITFSLGVHRPHIF